MHKNGDFMQLVDSDRLAIMREEDVVQIQNVFRRKLMKARRTNDSSDDYQSSLEVELCYIYREIEIRDARRKSHLEYMNSRASRSRSNTQRQENS
jgi:hypothetical protein